MHAVLILYSSVIVVHFCAFLNFYTRPYEKQPFLVTSNFTIKHRILLIDIG